MWYKKSEAIQFDWIMDSLFRVSWEFETALEEWPDEKWRNVFEKEGTARGYTDEIKDIIGKELLRFFVWRDDTVARWKAEEEAERLKKARQEQEEREWEEELRQRAASELIPFEKVLNEIFEDELELLSAVYEWSDQDWHGKFEEKILEGLQSGQITEEDAVDIRGQLDAYIERFLEYAENSKKESAEAAKNKEEKERIKREQIEKELAEDRAREQRKVKSLPEVMELVDAYSSARTKLADGKSKEHYLDLLNVCYNVICNWELVGCLDEFAGVFKVYEDTVLDYLHTARSIESLYQTVNYYTDARILWKLDLKERKKHLLKGMGYVEAFHKMADDEESACIYIECLLQLCESCRTGEDLEQLSYADKAYKLAKKYALKYRSDRMMEELDNAKLTMAIYYRMHGQGGEDSPFVL